MKKQDTNYTKKRWIILFACCLANLCLGSIYAWSVFASPMADYLTSLRGTAITTGDLAIVYTVANAVGPITMITGGWFNDRFGPKKVIFVGGALFGTGMIASSFANGIRALLVTYGLMCGLGLGMAYGCTISSCVKFFPDKRGLIGGITTAVYGFSSVILPPVVTTIVQRASVTTAFRYVGMAFLGIMTICSLIVEQCPAGFVPEGWTPPAAAAKKQASLDLDWRGMLRSPVFYVMLVLLMCGAFSGMMIISQASAVASGMLGMTAAAAGVVVSVLALFNACGRLLAGYISDRIGRINTLLISCILSFMGLLLLAFVGSRMPAFYGGIALTGLSFGAFMGVYPGFTADQFGAKNNSVNYGIMFIGFALAGLFGPMIMKNIYASAGSYNRAFLVAAALSAAGACLTFVCRRLTRRN